MALLKSVLVACLVVYFLFIECQAAVTKKAEPRKSTAAPFDPAKTNDKCDCGIFKSAKRSKETPLFYQTALQNFNCNEEHCKHLCATLPTFSGPRSAEVICANLNQAQGLRPAIQYKSCNDKWVSAGPAQVDPVCCSDGLVIGC